MLEEMRIRCLGVIEDAVLELHAGLTVLTGETGAGKTMVMQGLGLLAGGRADAGLVRAGCGRAVVEGRIRVPPDGPAAARAVEAGAELDDGDLLVSRTVSVEGRSRAHVGGRAVPSGVLAELADGLLALHGQSDQHRLLRPAEQRAALDRFAGQVATDLLAGYAQTYTERIGAAAELARRTAAADERLRQAQLLRLGLAEVERVGPQPGEDRELAAELRRLEHADVLLTAAASAQETLSGADDGDGGVLAGLAAARRALESASAHDAALDAVAGRLREVAYLSADLAADLGSYAAGVEAEPARLSAAQQRVSELTALARAHACDLDGVLAWAAHASEQLLDLDADADLLPALAEREAALRARLAAQAAELSDVRAAAASRFGGLVAAELRDLAMPHAEVRAVLSRRPDPAGLLVDGEAVSFGPSGVDEVELRLVPHSGAAERPLARGASGGELSRVMLAVEVVLAGADTTPTLVFDEVDAGVGGRAAVEVGRRLARLARSHQVVCVTHLPQVAAFADRHLVVHKADDGRVTRSGVSRLDDAGRVEELSRMLAGLDDSDLARGHAEELLTVAASDRGR